MLNIQRKYMCVRVCVSISYEVNNIETVEERKIIREYV